MCHGGSRRAVAAAGRKGSHDRVSSLGSILARPPSGRLRTKSPGQDRNVDAREHSRTTTDAGYSRVRSAVPSAARVGGLLLPVGRGPSRQPMISGQQARGAVKAGFRPRTTSHTLSWIPSTTAGV